MEFKKLVSDKSKMAEKLLSFVVEVGIDVTSMTGSSCASWGQIPAEGS
jgi:hypothetical protein